MKLTPEEAREIIYGDNQEWEKIEKTMEGRRRWSIDYSSIYLHKPSNECYCFNYSVGATEQQDERPFEYDSIVEPVKVVKKEVVKHEWVAAS